MGIILDTDSKILALERRRESYLICDLLRKFVGGEDTRRSNKSNHIFAYCDGEIEMSKEFLAQLLTYFDSRPEDKEEVMKWK